MSKLACVFPGQGSQSVGMLAELASNYPLVKDTFSEASDALGYDLLEVSLKDPNNTLNKTEVTQPALLTASFAAWRVLVAEKQIAPDYLAGHSLGEYTALVVANVLKLSDAVKLVEARGQYMQAAVPEGTGAMYAIIGLDDEKIINICAEISAQTNLVVSPVNFNSPGQIVIAGNKEAAEMAGEACKVAGAKRVLPLAVSVPSHCALMKPAAEQLADLLGSIKFSQPQFSVVNNADVSIEHSVAAIKQALIKQLYSPVRWTQSIEYLVKQGVTKIIEVGPGKVLTGLNKRIDKSLELSNFNSPADL